MSFIGGAGDKLRSFGHVEEPFVQLARRKGDEGGSLILRKL
jgi:hypothetical protein